jgi:hypothetical protein
MQEPMDTQIEALEAMEEAAEKANEALSRGCIFMYRVIEEDFDIVVSRQDLHLGVLAETPDMYAHEKEALDRAYYLAKGTSKQVLRTYS